MLKNSISGFTIDFKEKNLWQSILRLIYEENRKGYLGSVLAISMGTGSGLLVSNFVCILLNLCERAVYCHASILFSSPFTLDYSLVETKQKQFDR